MVGKQLGHYEILKPLGTGGMGEVYRARDRKLEREVALKILPHDFAADTDRLARFGREAKLLAGLNHPNIATIHALEHVDGLHFLVLELAEGESLDRVLARGPLPVADALDIARQIAAALETAHRAGIVHRDLKPANVMVTSDRRTKVLDFGIAKSLGETPSPGATSEATDLTVDGALVGTPAYMSPERIRGHDLDKRADIWAFGCVVYEMLSGAKAFPAETLADVFAAIIEREPDWERLPPETPPSVQQVLRRCLQKDPSRRLHHLADARIEIEDSAPRRGDPATTPPGPEQRRGRAPVLIGIVMIVAAIAGGFFLRDLLGPVPPEAWDPVQVTRSPGVETHPSLSPDGQFVVFASDRAGNLDIWRQRIGGEARNLTPDSPLEDRTPAFSPDGSRIAFRSDRGSGGGIYLMGATGEDPHLLVDHGFAPAWSPDGRQLAFAAVGPYTPTGLFSGGISIVDVDDPTQVREVVELGYRPSWSPNGHRIAFYSFSDGGQRDIYTVRPDGSSLTRVTDDPWFDWAPIWSADGQRLFFSSNRGSVLRNIWSIEIDEQSGLPGGEPQRVGASESEQAWLAMSADGSTIAYASVRQPFNLQRVAFDPDRGQVVGAPEPITRGANDVYRFDVSPDGRNIVYATQQSMQEDLYLIPADGDGAVRQLTDDAANDREPMFVDSTRVIFYSDRSGRYEIWTLDTETRQMMQQTFSEPGAGTVMQPVPSPDAAQFVYTIETPGQEEVVLQALEGAPEEAPVARTLLEPRVDIFRPTSWSPNGRWVVGFSNASIEPRIQLLSPESSELTDIGDFRGHAHPAWLGNDRIIFTRNATIRGVATRRESLMIADRESGAYRSLLPDGEDWTFGEPVRASPDGRWIYFVREEFESDVWVLRRRGER